jgi:hypothetical protein
MKRPAGAWEEEDDTTKPDLLTLQQQQFPSNKVLSYFLLSQCTGRGSRFISLEIFNMMSHSFVSQSQKVKDQ